MINRFGVDIKLDENGDIILNPNGDIMTTQDYEDSKNTVKFTGYWSVMTAIMNRLSTAPGTYPFDPTFGSNLPARVSKVIDSNFANSTSLVVSQALLQDDRVKKVVGVSTEIIGGNIVVIRATVILIGTDQVSELVFPEMFIS